MSNFSESRSRPRSAAGSGRDGRSPRSAAQRTAEPRAAHTPGGLPPSSSGAERWPPPWPPPQRSSSRSCRERPPVSRQRQGGGWRRYRRKGEAAETGPEQAASPKHALCGGRAARPGRSDPVRRRVCLHGASRARPDVCLYLGRVFSAQETRVRIKLMGRREGDPGGEVTRGQGGSAPQEGPVGGRGGRERGRETAGEALHWRRRLVHKGAARGFREGQRAALTSRWASR